MRSIRNPSRRRRRAKGVVLIYVVILFTVLCGFVSLAVDFGRVQTCKTELLGAANAAARAAAATLPNGISATQTAAVTWGGFNTADGSSVVIDPNNDVIFGTWSTTTRTLTVLSGAARSGANAIQVNAHLIAARGAGIPLLFAGVLGRSTCDANETAIAYVPPGGYGLVGMTSISMAKEATDSYDSAAGAYSAGSAGQSGYLASNGGITLGSGSTISQNLYMVAGQTLSATGSTFGTRNVLPSNIVWPQPSAGSFTTTNSNGNLGLPADGGAVSFSSGSVTIPPGTYYIDSLDMSGGTITFSGATTVLINGSLTISGGSIVVSSGHPSDLTIKIVTASTVSVTGGSDLFADIQAPTSSITMKNISNYYGRLIGSTLSVTTNMAFHVDTSLPAVSGTSSPSGSGTGIISVK